MTGQKGFWKGYETERTKRGEQKGIALTDQKARWTREKVVGGLCITVKEGQTFNLQT